jgi:type VI secretion system protein ImpA
LPDAASNSSALKPPADSWLLPLSDEQPCGADLEYDPEALELGQVTGKPESQFGPAEPADWPRVKEICESLFTRTRDLRAAMWWGRARFNLEGFVALPATLALMHGLLERFWNDLHPQPDGDDPDALARLSVLGGLDTLDSLLGDIRNSRLSSDPRLDGLRVRDVEVALSRLTPRPDEQPRTQGQITGMLAAAEDVAVELRVQADAALNSLKQIQTLMSERFSADLNVDLTTIHGMLASVMSVLPAPAAEGDRQVDTDAGQGAVAAARRAGGVHSVDSRQDAIRAIELVCAYLERHEPTNPAQLLLRRAARVVDKNFLQLVKELAPDAVKEVSRIMGVDPSTVNDEN